jgi:hypothetical protein
VAPSWRRWSGRVPPTQPATRALRGAVRKVNLSWTRLKAGLTPKTRSPRSTLQWSLTVDKGVVGSSLTLQPGVTRLSKIDTRSLLFGAAASLLVAGLVGCSPGPTSSSSAPQLSGTSGFSLVVHNVDGPPLTLKVNGTVVADSVCQLGSSSPAPFIVPNSTLPLPWNVTLVRADGSNMGSWTESGNNGPRQILIRGNQAAELPADEPGGPPPASCAP